jgi:acyl carrier protein
VSDSDGGVAMVERRLTDMEITAQVRQYITKNFYVSEASPLTDETSFLDNGIVDSTGVLEVIGFLEKQFDIRVEDDEMLPDNLDSIGKIAAFVRKKRG